MLSYKDFVGVFFNRKPVESMAAHKASIKDALIVHAKAFFPVSFLLVFEAIFLSIIAGMLASKPIAVSVLDSFVLGLVLLVLLPIFYVAQVVFVYVWACAHFFIAGLIREKSGHMNEFAAISLEAFSCVEFVSCLFALIPVLGWLIIPFSAVRGILLYQKLIKAKLGLTDAQSGIVIFALMDFLLLVLLILSVIISGILIGPKIFVR